MSIFRSFQSILSNQGLFSAHSSTLHQCTLCRWHDSKMADAEKYSFVIFTFPPRIIRHWHQDSIYESCRHQVHWLTALHTNASYGYWDVYCPLVCAETYLYIQILNHSLQTDFEDTLPLNLLESALYGSFLKICMLYEDKLTLYIKYGFCPSCSHRKWSIHRSVR